MAPKKVTPRGKAAKPPVNKPKTAAKKPARKPRAKKTEEVQERRFIRNLTGAAGGVRLVFESQYKLEPRGFVGDMVQVYEDDWLSPNYTTDLGILFEELTVEQAKEVLTKQSTNAQAPRQDALMDVLRNERGEKYTQADPTIEQPFERQGQVVATVEDGPEGRFTTGYQGKITRTSAEAPQQVPVPGSAQNPGPQVPSDIPPEQVADWVARNRAQDEQAAADALRDSLNVTGP